MKKVKITSGTYGYKPEGAKFITPVKAGEVVEVSNEEAARLVSLGVAVCIVDGTQKSTDTPVATPDGDADDGGEGENPPDDGSSAEGQGNSGSAQLPEGEDDTLDIVDGHFTMESLMKMTRADMESLAADLGVDVSKFKNKTEIAALLTVVEVEPDDPKDNETPPDLGAAPPVV